jgi:hypothetical protein
MQAVIALARLRPQSSTILCGDDCVHIWIDLLNMIEISRRHLHARDLSRSNGIGERDCVYHNEL